MSVVSSDRNLLRQESATQLQNAPAVPCPLPVAPCPMLAVASLLKVICGTEAERDSHRTGKKGDKGDADRGFYQEEDKKQTNAHPAFVNPSGAEFHSQIKATRRPARRFKKQGMTAPSSANSHRTSPSSWVDHNVLLTAAVLQEEAVAERWTDVSTN